jgi:hypothetical protein
LRRCKGVERAPIASGAGRHALWWLMGRFRSSLRSALPVLAAAGLVLVTAGPSVEAQSDLGMYDVLTQRHRFAPGPGPRIVTVPQQRVRAPVRRVLQPALPANPAIAQGPRQKVEPSVFVVVMGDTLGELLSAGLDDALGDVPTAEVVRSTRADSGIVRSDFHDWPKTVQDILAGGQRITVGVMMLGANDRQAIREGELTHEPLSERWREIYRERVDRVANAFAERRIPLVWVGMPPMQNARLSGDMVNINELVRQRVERSGGFYVDLWPGFVDEENRYSAAGPDLNGQIARLRTGDGVHFTRAGARKAAHFVDVALRRLVPELGSGPATAQQGPVPAEAQQATRQAALPQATQQAALPPQGADPIPLPLELQPGGIEKLIDQMARLGRGVGAGPEIEPIAPPEIKVKPAAGPIRPLTGPAISPGGALTPTLAAARGPGGPGLIFGDGAPPPPQPGRADDFRWPRTP